MGLWGRIAGELVDVIEWVDEAGDVVAWRHERRDRAIRNGAMLTVREGQAAVLVSEGQVADVFGPGMYELLTRNLPVLATLQAWPHGFESPFKADLHFFSTRRLADLKWGTRNPVILRDPEFGPVRVRAFGTYAMRVKDPVTFLREVVGTDGRLTAAEVGERARGLIAARFAAAIGAAGVPVLDLAAGYDRLGRLLAERVAPDLAAWGLDLLQLLVENVSLPPEVEQVLDRRTSIGIVGDLGRYARFQAAEAVRDAAAGAGVGLGVALGADLGQRIGGPAGPWGAHPDTGVAYQAPPEPPPLPGGIRRYHVAESGSAAGPYPPEELRSRVLRGEIRRSTLVWAEGMPRWRAAGEVEDLEPLFASVPPPLPSPGAG